MEEVTITLIKCSCCKSQMMESFFTIHPKTSIRYKTCDGCRERVKVIKRIANAKVKPQLKCPRSGCTYMSSESSNISRHIKGFHDKICNFVCSHENCVYKCLNKVSLQNHIRAVHNNIRDFVCTSENCDAKFSENSYLKIHIRTVHHNIRDFVCLSENCDAKFSTNGNLQRHIKFCTNGRVGSSGEVAIKEILDSMRIAYQYNTPYKVKADRPLRWDFIIPSDEPLFIEFDGKQHFEPRNFGGMSNEKADEEFEKTKAHDKLKNDFCKDNNLLLLRIHYTQFGNINKLVADFIIENTSWGFE